MRKNFFSSIKQTILYHLYPPRVGHFAPNGSSTKLRSFNPSLVITSKYVVALRRRRYFKSFFRLSNICDKPNRLCLSFLWTFKCSVMYAILAVRAAIWTPDEPESADHVANSLRTLSNSILLSSALEAVSTPLNLRTISRVLLESDDADECASSPR